MSRVAVLGGGFGGLTVATELRRLLGDRVEISLVDRREHFAMGLRKLWEAVGIGTIAEGSRPRSELDATGIRFIRREVTAIDPSARVTGLDDETLEADHLVVALGCEPRPDLVPGLAEQGHDVWNPGAVPRLRQALETFAGGRIAIVIAGGPYPCPPAPYELAFLLDEWLRGRGLRDRSELVVTTFQPLLLPNAGRAGSDWIAAQLERRGIASAVGRQVERVDEAAVRFADGELSCDLLIGVPPHRAPEVVAAGGLTDGDWVSVDPGTLETRHANVYAVGDVTQITLANGLPLPKAGVIAELEGARVAAAVAARIEGRAEPPPFDGRGYCFVETGHASAALVDGDFYAEPEPLVTLRDATEEHAREKRRFESERLARWFGEPSNDLP